MHTFIAISKQDLVRKRNILMQSVALLLLVSIFAKRSMLILHEAGQYS